MKHVYAILIVLVLAGCSAVPTFVSHDIPNFRPVPGHVGVYRGGQPKSEAAWAYLQSIGVSNVVKLNLESDASDSEARALGMTVRYYPINTLHQIILKPDRQLWSLSASISASQRFGGSCQWTRRKSYRRASEPLIHAHGR